MAYGILVAQIGIKLMPPPLEAWSFNHGTNREDPDLEFIIFTLSPPQEGDQKSSCSQKAQQLVTMAASGTPSCLCTNMEPSRLNVK